MEPQLRALDSVWVAAAGTGYEFAAGEASPSVTDIVSIASLRARIEHCAYKLRSGTLCQQAFASGLDALLRQFLQDAAAVERTIVETSNISDAHVRYSLHHYTMKFPQVAECAEKVTREDLKGGAIANAVCANLGNTGDADMRSIWNQLLRHTNRPLFSFLIQWMGYGELTDEHQEFFVRTTFTSEFPDKRPAQLYRSGTFAEETVFNAGITSSKCALPIPLQQLQAELEFLRGAYIDDALVPTLLMSETQAQDSLLVGTAVRLLRSREPSTSAIDEWEYVAALHRGEKHYEPDDDTANANSRFSFLQSLQISRLLSTVREAEEFSPVAFDFALSKIKAFVFGHLWELIVTNSQLLEHVQALRDYLLMGRGDLFRALHERLRPMKLHLASPNSIVGTITSGPWVAAASIANIQLEGEALRVDRSLSSPDELRRASLFDRCFWYLHSQCVAWHAPDPFLIISGDMSGLEDTRTERTSTRGSIAPRLSNFVGRAANSYLRSWFPVCSSDIERSGVLSRTARADSRMLSVGSSGVASLNSQAVRESAEALDETAARLVSVSDESLWAVETLFVARDQSSSREASHPCAGAVWLSTPIAVRTGFAARGVVHLHMKAKFEESSSSGNANTASFAFVVHRDHTLALGTSEPAAHLLKAAVPGCGYSGIASAVIVHVLCKRIHSVKLGSAAPHTGFFRVVVAVYSPADSTGSRSLLASGAAMEYTAKSSYVYMSEVHGSLMNAFPVPLFIEYSSPESLGSQIGRLRVCLADVTPKATRDTISSHVVVDAPFTLESILDLVGWTGPGIGRCHMGLTADAGFHDVSAPATIGHMPLVSVDWMDIVSFSEEDEEIAGLTLGYSLPSPLHAVLGSGTFGLLQDVFRIMFRAKSASLALQDTWRLLMDSFSLSASTGAGLVTDAPVPIAAAHEDSFASAATRRGRRWSVRSDTSFATTISAVSGVSSQVSGFGGKRSKDPGVYERQRMRLAVHKLLQPVWLLRGQMSATIDAILFHMHVDVIESATKSFCEGVQAVHDFPGLLKAHNDYIHSIRSGCFIAQPSVTSCLKRMLRSCERFCQLVQKCTPNLASLLQPTGGRGDFTAIQGNFQSDTRMLLGLLQSGSQVSDASSLITRLDFNGFFAVT